MRQLYPVLWVATFGLAALPLLRPSGLGTLLALAANWENVPWSDTYTPSVPPSSASPPAAVGPNGPRASSRPAAWPTSAPGVSDASDEDPRDTPARTAPPTTNPLRYPETNYPAEPVSLDKRAPIAQEPRPVDDAPAQPPTGTDAAPEARSIPCEGAEILGQVGSEVILTKELSSGIAELRARNKDVPQDVLEARIREILKQRLDQKIDEKLVVLDAQRTIPAENFPKVKDNVAREFEASQVPRLTKALGARTRQELEDMLEAAGTSLEMQKRNFIDQILAQEWLKQQTKIDEDVSHEQALSYYREHVAEYETPARARWEQLTVKASRLATRGDAYAALAQMGNQVLSGTPLSEVARSQSHGSTAQEGGSWDWTSQGSLTSQLLDRVIFGDGTRPGLPVGELSPILEEEQAFHIIRVVQREPPRRTPFVEAQVGIKKKIRAQREGKARQDYLARLRRQTPVWTVFDTPATAAAPFGWLR